MTKIKMQLKIDLCIMRTFKEAEPVMKAKKKWFRDKGLIENTQSVYLLYMYIRSRSNLLVNYLRVNYLRVSTPRQASPHAGKWRQICCKWQQTDPTSWDPEMGLCHHQGEL